MRPTGGTSPAGLATVPLCVVPFEDVLAWHGQMLRSYRFTVPVAAPVTLAGERSPGRPPHRPKEHVMLP